MFAIRFNYRQMHDVMRELTSDIREACPSLGALIKSNNLSSYEHPSPYDSLKSMLNEPRYHELSFNINSGLLSSVINAPALYYEKEMGFLKSSVDTIYTSYDVFKDRFRMWTSSDNLYMKTYVNGFSYSKRRQSVMHTTLSDLLGRLSYMHHIFEQFEKKESYYCECIASQSALDAMKQMLNEFLADTHLDRNIPLPRKMSSLQLGLQYMFWHNYVRAGYSLKGAVSQRFPNAPYKLILKMFEKDFNFTDILRAPKNWTCKDISCKYVEDKFNSDGIYRSDLYRDAVSMLKQMQSNAKFSLDWSDKRAKKEHDNITRKFNRWQLKRTAKDEGLIVSTPAYKAVELAAKELKLPVVPLNTSMALAREGISMSHCVGSAWNSVKSGNLVVMSTVFDERATPAFQVVKNHGKLRLVQHCNLGYRNNAVSRHNEKMLQLLQDKANELLMTEELI